MKYRRHSQVQHISVNYFVAGAVGVQQALTSQSMIIDYFITLKLKVLSVCVKQELHLLPVGLSAL